MSKPDWGVLQQRFLSDHAVTGVSPKDWCEAQGLNYTSDGSVKESFVRDGAALKETYDLQAGSITTQPTQTKNNQDVNALMEYTIEYRNVVRNV